MPAVCAKHPRYPLLGARTGLVAERGGASSPASGVVRAGTRYGLLYPVQKDQEAERCSPGSILEGDAAQGVSIEVWRCHGGARTKLGGVVDADSLRAC